MNRMPWLFLFPGREQGEYVLFCREFDEKKALWEGAHSGLEGATTHYEADDAFPIDDLDDILPGLLENKSKVYYPMGRDSELDHSLLEWINHIRSSVQNRRYCTRRIGFLGACFA